MEIENKELLVKLTIDGDGLSLGVSALRSPTRIQQSDPGDGTQTR